MASAAPPVPVHAAATDRFFEKVRRFFALMSSEDGFITLKDAKPRMARILSREHAHLSPQLGPQPGGGARLDAEVNEKVNTLFHAAGHDHDRQISLDEFEEMYRKLLKAHYEPEVLELDLDRAIKSLEEAAQ